MKSHAQRAANHARRDTTLPRRGSQNRYSPRSLDDPRLPRRKSHPEIPSTKSPQLSRTISFTPQRHLESFPRGPTQAESTKSYAQRAANHAPVDTTLPRRGSQNHPSPLSRSAPARPHVSDLVYSPRNLTQHSTSRVRRASEQRLTPSYGRGPEIPSTKSPELPRTVTSRRRTCVFAHSATPPRVSPSRTHAGGVNEIVRTPHRQPRPPLDTTLPQRGSQNPPSPLSRSVRCSHVSDLL